MSLILFVFFVSIFFVMCVMLLCDNEIVFLFLSSWRRY